MFARLLVLVCVAFVVPAAAAAEASATTHSAPATTQAASPAVRPAELRQDADNVDKLLREINERLETMTERVFNAPDNAARTRENESAVMLNGLKTRYQFRLDELRRQVRDAEFQQTADVFAGHVDVFMSAEELNRNAPSITAVTFHDTIELAGKPYVRLKSGHWTWTIDPTR